MLPRRAFLSAALASLVSASVGVRPRLWASDNTASLPMGGAPAALQADWFPSPLHAFVWRNWALVPARRLASVLGARPKDIRAMALSMGLEPARGLTPGDLRRAGLTIIRRNWHLLPYAQLLDLLGWTAEELAYTLREDDFFFVKLGLLKPKCDPLRWRAPTPTEAARAREIKATVKELYPAGALEGKDPLFSFVKTLSKPPPASRRQSSPGLRLGYSYFALYGDPLLDPALDPYPDGYLARLAASGVNAVWLQGVLSRLAPIPWAPESHIEKRKAALRSLAARAARHGIQIFLYLNEPRSLPATSLHFTNHPDWRGVLEGDFAAVCTSAPDVRDALRSAIASLCRDVPGLGGFFTISASENLSNCWSHNGGGGCPRCKSRTPAEVIAEVNTTFHDGIRAAGGPQRLLAWDWGWHDSWAPEIIERLPRQVQLMSVSEWSLPIERGGVKTTVGEYSLSSIGPGPRALRHWTLARQRGLRVTAKIQTGNTWELSAVPFIPVLENIARHIRGLRAAGVEDLMLGWTLGGRPSPNMDAVAEISAGGSLESLALRRHGKAASAAVEFWTALSAAFREFPFDGGLVYNAPLQMGPANPLWPLPTGYRATMVGIPYDDLDAWRGPYPVPVFISQLEKVADGFEAALANLRAAIPNPSASLAEEARFAAAAAIHFASVAQQTRFVAARKSADSQAMRQAIQRELQLAVRLHSLQSRDSQIGFEASNQYYYIPHDLVEKALNCRWLAQRLA